MSIRRHTPRIALRACLLVASLVATGCATGGPSIPASTLSACPVIGAPSEWREVLSEAVRFCIPPTWSPSGSQRWRGPDGSMEWSTTPARRQVGSVTTIVRGSGGRPPTAADIRSQTEADMRALEVYREREMIDGAEAMVYIVGNAQSGYSTGARWTSPQLFMFGEAPSLAAAELLRQIVRTARLAPR